MPIYEYRCEGCGLTFARLQSINASAEAVSCPDCDSDDTRRLLSTFAAASSSTDGMCPAGPVPSCGGGGGG